MPTAPENAMKTWKPAPYTGDPTKPCACKPNEDEPPCGHPGCPRLPHAPAHRYQAKSAGDPCRLCGQSLGRHRKFAPELNQDL